jgi:hypothetical protein
MKCDKCNSERVASIMGKCSDLSVINLLGIEHEGYVPDDVGIGGGDYMRFDLCLDCGKVQGEFPLPDPKFYIEDEEDE